MRPGGRRPLVMGVLNVTPDSFSDGGLYVTPESAVARGLQMVEAGADLIDVGGESSRPGAEPVPVAVELERVVPVLEALAAATSRSGSGVRLSVDTVKPEVAAAALAAGASLVNDISASLWEVAAAAGAGWVAMHMRGQPRTMQESPRYGAVVEEVRSFLLERAGLALQAGVREVWVDPGIGFGKTSAHNLSLLKDLPRIADLGAPMLVGVSRKSFIGRILGRAVDERLYGGLGLAALAVLKGARIIRTHDVSATRDAIGMVSAVLQGIDA